MFEEKRNCENDATHHSDIVRPTYSLILLLCTNITWLDVTGTETSPSRLDPTTMQSVPLIIANRNKTEPFAPFYLVGIEICAGKNLL